VRGGSEQEIWKRKRIRRMENGEWRIPVVSEHPLESGIWNLEFISFPV
jgi:hypothetical protein